LLMMSLIKKWSFMKTNKFIEVYMPEYCQVCKAAEAEFDCKTIAGFHAYMCKDCTKRFGKGPKKEIKYLEESA